MKRFDPDNRRKEEKQTHRKRWYKAVCSLAAVVVVCTVYTLMLPALTLDDEGAGSIGVESHVSDNSASASDSGSSDNNSTAAESSSDTAADSSADSSPAGAESGTAADAPSDDSAPSAPETTPTDNGTSTLPADSENASGIITGESESSDEVTSPDADNTENNENNEEINNSDSSSDPATDSEADENDADKSDDTADVETAADWEATVHDAISAENWNSMTWAEKLIAVAQTQIGYKESVLNFRVDNEGNHKGYTRYGEWYGNPYGDWCAMFVSFCLNYAGIDQEAIPQNANCSDWVKNLDRMGIYEDKDLYVPEAGDIVFFDQTGAGKPNHVGIIEEVAYGTKTITRHITKNGSAIESSTTALLSYINELQSGEAAEDTLETEEVEIPVAESIKVIEGNSSDRVQYVTYDASDDNILGYVSLTNAKNVFEGVDPDKNAEEQPVVETPTVKEYEVAGDYKITATYTSDAKLPESTTLKARELTGDEYDEHYQMALEELGVEELSFARFFDITFESADGFKLEPAADSTVDIQISYYDDNNKPEIKENETANAVHFGENGTEILPVETTGDPESIESMSFTQSSFSVTGTVVSSDAIADGKYVILSGNSGTVNAMVDSSGTNKSASVSNSKVTIESTDSTSIGIQVTSNTFKYGNYTYTLTRNSDGSYYAKAYYGYYYLRYGKNNNGGGNNNRQSWNYTTTPTVIYLSSSYRVVPKQYTITFNNNGGNVTAPASVAGTQGETFTFPEYTGKNGNNVFVGWSTNSNANGTGQAAVAPVYAPGTELEITGDVTYYAIYAAENGGSCFYIALDGKTRTEPRTVTGSDAADFTYGVHINEALKVAKFYSNSAGVDANLNASPSLNDIKRMVNNAVSRGKTVVGAENGVEIQDGKLYAKNSNGTVDTSKEMYVVWYVIKNAIAGPCLDSSNYGGHCNWHVDGVLLTKSKVTLYYSPGENVSSTEVQNLPDGSQYDVDTPGVLAGNHRGNNNDIKTPTRTGYTFTGWKAYKYSSTAANNMGEYIADYQPGDPFTIHEDTILVAQWQLNQTGVVLKKVNKSGDPLTGAVFILRKMNSNGVYDFYKGNQADSTYTVNNTNGINLGMLEDGSYQLEEVTAPDGYNLLTDTIEFTVNNNEVTIATDDKTVATVLKAGNGYVISVINESGYELPETGGTGTLPYLLGGLLLTMPLTIRIIKRRRSEERRKN